MEVVAKVVKVFHIDVKEFNDGEQNFIIPKTVKYQPIIISSFFSVIANDI